MRFIAQIVGYAYILATVLAMFGLIDMRVCVGKVGACNPTAAPTVI